MVYPDFSYSQSGGLIFFDNQSVNGTNFTWAFGDGNGSTSASTSHAYAQAGTYQVVFTVSNACHTESVTKQVEVSAANEITETETAAVKIYPSVTTGQLTVESSLAECSLSIYSVNGRLLLQQTLAKGLNSLNLNDMAPQNLFYTIKAGDKDICSGQLQKQ